MEKETALPKNVRQIGDIQGDKRIYMEDYVVTYIHKKEKMEEKEGFLGVFLGEMQKSEGETRLFIRGLMNIPLDRWQEETEESCGQGDEKEEQNLKNKTEKAEDGSGKRQAKVMEAADEDWNKETWETEKDWEFEEKAEDRDAESKRAGNENAVVNAEAKSSARQQKKRRKRTVQEECRDYFGDMEILGCCVVGRYQVEPMKRLIEEVPQSRRLLYHLQEQEEHLYWTETGKYEEISGYFVFYEQNRKMQEYMSESFDEREGKEKIADQAIKAFREKIKKKDQMQTAGIMKLASSFFVVTVLIVGAIVVTRIGSIRDTSGTDNTRIKTSVPDGGSGSGNSGMYDVPDAASVSGSSIIDGTAAGTGTASGTNMTYSTEASAEAAGMAEGTMAAAGNKVSGDAASAITRETGDAASVTNQAVDAASEINGTAADTGAAASWPAGDTGAADGASGDAVSAAGGALGDTSAASGSGAAGDTAAASGSGAVEDAAVAAAEYGASEDMASAGSGNADSAALSSGQPAVQEDVEASAPVRQIRSSYVIREGDTLADICQKYYGNMNKLEEICLENGIENADKIMPGQKIVLP